MIQKLFTLIKLILELPLVIVYYISGVIPKDASIWVIGSYHGKYIDNSKYLFEYISKTHSEITIIWLSGNRELIKTLRSKGYTASWKYGLSGFLLSFRAKVVIVSSYRNNVNPYAINNSFVVNLWHGYGLKTIEYDIPVDYNNNFKKKRKMFDMLSYLLPRFNMSYDLVTVPSEIIKEKFKNAFKIPKSIMVVTGDPRMDRLFINSPSNDDQNIILYVPTFRSKKPIDYFSFQFDPEEWQYYLLEVDHYLHIKFHQNDKNLEMVCSDRFHKYNRIKIMHRSTDLYSMLNRVSIVITDYSSIMFDSIAINIPVLFMPLEMEQYLSDERPFYFDYYKEIADGYHFSNWNYLLTYMENNAISEIKPSPLLSEFHKYKDNKSCERVFNEITKRIS